MAGSPPRRTPPPYKTPGQGNRQQAAADEARLSMMDCLGIVLRPESRPNLENVIAGLGTGGGRILLCEGVWNFRRQILIETPSVEIVALSPGRTVFRRETAINPVTEIASFLHITTPGDGFVIEGVRFEAPNEPNAPALYTRSGAGALGVRVARCLFADVGSAVLIGEGRGHVVIDNRVLQSHVQSTDPDPYVFRAAGSVTDSAFLDNMVAGTHAGVIEFWADDNAERILFDGNHCIGGGDISYKTGKGCAGDATNNLATVTVRP